MIEVRLHLARMSGFEPGFSAICSYFLTSPENIYQLRIGNQLVGSFRNSKELVAGVFQVAMRPMQHRAGLFKTESMCLANTVGAQRSGFITLVVMSVHIHMHAYLSI